jgi:hypothetical protein
LKAARAIAAVIGETAGAAIAARGGRISGYDNGAGNISLCPLPVRVFLRSSRYAWPQDGFCASPIAVGGACRPQWLMN